MKLLISDLDGTLYPHKNAKNPTQLQDNLKAVKQWVESGNKFAAASARGLHHYPILKEKLGFDVNYIGCNGAHLMLETGEKKLKQMPNSIFIDLCRFVKVNLIDATVATGINNQWVWSSIDCYPKDVPAYQAKLEDVFLAELDKIDPNGGNERIQVFTPTKNKEILKAQIIARNYPVTVTSSDHDLIDIGPENCSKGISIIELCRLYDIDMDDIIVVGDSENDVPMFEITKHSYCIDHAEPSVINSASRCVASVAEVITIELNK